MLRPFACFPAVCGLWLMNVCATLAAADGFPQLISTGNFEAAAADFDVPTGRREAELRMAVGEANGRQTGLSSSIFHSPSTVPDSSAPSPRLDSALRPDDVETVFRAQGPADEGVVVPLVQREAAEFLPVKGLNIPNPLPLLRDPLSLIGNPLTWHGGFRGAWGSNFDQGSMTYGNLVLVSGLPIGIDTEFAYRIDPRLILARRAFWNGDFNLVYHIKQIRYVVFRMGVGTNWQTDGVDTDLGFNSTYGFDVILKKPFYLGATIDWGRLGTHGLLHWQFTGGLDFGRLQLFVGYDFYEVGKRERKNVIAGAGLLF